MFTSQRKSVFTIFSLVLVVLAYVQYRLDIRAAYTKSFEVEMQRKERGIRLLASIASTVHSTGRIDTLEAHLSDALRTGLIDFYLVTFKDEVVSFESYRKMSDAAYVTLKGLHPPEKFWTFDSSFEPEGSLQKPASGETLNEIEEFRFFETDLGNQWRIKIGNNINREAYIQNTEEQFKDENRRMLVLGILLTLAIFLFSARDVLRVAQAIRSRGTRSLRTMTTFSAEGEALKKGVGGYEEAVERLESERRALDAQVLPSLRSELQSNQTPPYDFDCTLVRTDINGFTKIFHSHPTEPFLETINNFFKKCSHIISRYDGLIHEFVGDEIIFYFKDAKHMNSFTAALACITEMNQVAENIHEQTTKRDGYDFRVKSSLAHGKLRFGPLLNGFSLAGSPLIETTRILSAVTEKNENTVHFDSRHEHRLHAAVECDFAFNATLKGIEGDRKILRYHRHKPFLLVTKLGADFQNIVADFRSETSIIQMLGIIQFDPSSFASLHSMRVINQLQITEPFLGLADALCLAIRNLSENVENEASDRALASLVRLIPRLVPHSQTDPRIREVIQSLLSHSNSRVAANAIEALHLFVSSGQEFDQRVVTLLDSQQNRIAANALAYFGQKEISQDIVKRIQLGLKSKDAAKISSTLFAIGEIASHHKKMDPVYYRTQEKFHSILKQVPKLAREYPEIKNQVEITLKKAA